MPEMNGYEVLTKIRSDPLIATTPFIFLTSKTTGRDIRAGMELGADDYLTKPFMIHTLLTAIRTQLKKHDTISKQMDELRANLMLMLPHELLTPLNVIIGFSSFLKDPEKLPETADIVTMGQSIYESGLRLQRLVENYLLYADLKVMEHDTHKRNVWQESSLIEMESFLRDFSFNPARRVGREQDLILDLVEAAIEMSPKALVKILEELLGNAFKFSKPGTPVRVAATLDEEGFTVSVTDQGRGMTPEQVAHIDAFTQFDRKKYEQQGLGLGLVLVHRLVELNHGTVRFESVLEQRTTVRVVFPRTLSDKA
jgi:signal transduction histidine kinase